MAATQSSGARDLQVFLLLQCAIESVELLQPLTNLTLGRPPELRERRRPLGLRGRRGPPAALTLQSWRFIPSW